MESSSCIHRLSELAHEDIDEAMLCWNKVSPVSPYPDDVLSNTDEGAMSVCVLKYVGSIYILVVRVSFKESLTSYWCADFGILFHIVL